MHLNVPFPEPLYDLGPVPTAPELDDTLAMPSPSLVHALPGSFQRALTNGKALVVAGPDPGLTHRGTQKRRISLPCLAECGSGVHGPLTVHGGERLLVNGALPEALRPEVVLTMGLPPMSKAIRHALEGLPHMHVDGQGWNVWGVARVVWP